MYKKIFIKQGREKSFHYRHPWVFSGAISSMEKGINDGDLVRFCAADDRVLATGYFNSKCSIAGRILSFDEEEIDENFLTEKIKKAAEIRRDLLSGAVRMVFAESDSLPGLVVDKYSDDAGNVFLVIQIHTLGMEKLKFKVVNVLKKVFSPAAIVERSEIRSRKEEGMKSDHKEMLLGTLSEREIIVNENDLKFYVNLWEGQKTGFFIDQRDNRKSIRDLAHGKRVLNLYSYSGGFSANAILGGAKEVVSVDISKDAVELCDRNMKLNFGAHGVEKKHETICGDVIDVLTEMIAQERKFDLIIVDPPAFVKNKKNLDNALKAYVRLNDLALKVLENGGVLGSSSCSAYLNNELFRGMLFQAGLRSGVNLRLIEQRAQPLDHAINLDFPEGEYLKWAVLRKGEI